LAARRRLCITTISDKAAPCPLDHVNRQFQAAKPNAPWVSDFTYVATWSGFVYVAFVIDVFARRIVGWRASRTAHAAGSCITAIGAANTSRSNTPNAWRKRAWSLPWAAWATATTTLSQGTINGLYKAVVIHRRGPWRSFEAVEFATLEWVNWFNNRRLLEPIGNIPPAEAEERYYA
jgi:transposase InsO family protein